MTQRRKLLLVCSVIFTPILSLVALILRAAALFTEYGAGDGYFDGPLYTAFAVICALAFLFFLIAAILCRQELPICRFYSSLSVQFAAAFFIVALAVSAISTLFAIGAVTGLSKFFYAVSALLGLGSIAYFALFFLPGSAGSTRHGLLSLSPAFFSLFTAVILYFDRTTQMNAPSKLLHMTAFLLLACYFLAEGRGIIGAAMPVRHFMAAASTTLLAFSASVPNLLYRLSGGGTPVLSTVYDFLLLAAALYTLSRLLQLLPFEGPRVHDMIQGFLDRQEEAPQADLPDKEEAEDEQAS